MDVPPSSWPTATATPSWSASATRARARRPRRRPRFRPRSTHRARGLDDAAEGAGPGSERALDRVELAGDVLPAPALILVGDGGDPLGQLLELGQDGRQLGGRRAHRRIIT